MPLRALTRLLLVPVLLAGCGPALDTELDDDSPVQALQQLHLNLLPGAPLPAEQPYSAAAGSPCDTIVSVAMAEEGRGPNAVGQDLTVYPYKLSDYLASGEAWCSEFVSWVYKAAGQPFTGGSEGGWMLKGSTQIRSWFQNNKTFVQKGSANWSSFIPEPGDYIRYNTSSGGHSGIVRYAEGTTLYTIEGNVSNLVKRRTISNWKSYASLDGIGQLGLNCGCTTDGDCNDNNPCTTDSCVGGTCQNTPIAGCCTTDAQCDDGDPCTTDSCVSSACQHSPVPGCGPDGQVQPPDAGPPPKLDGSPSPSTDASPSVSDSLHLLHPDGTPPTAGAAPALMGGCSATPSQPPGPLALLLLLAVAVLWRVRR